MIVFKGQITGKCLERFKWGCKLERIILVIANVVFALLLVLLFSAVVHKPLYLSLLALTVFLITLTPSIVYLVFRAKPWSEIVFDTTEGVVHFNNGWKKHEFIKIDEISEINDYGDFYDIADTFSLTLCQKDLIVQGSIEEFENLFKEIIIQKDI